MAVFEAAEARRRPEVIAAEIHRQLGEMQGPVRYVELHREGLAAVFTREGRVQFLDRNPGFPFLNFQRGDRLPILPISRGADPLTDMIEADLEDWLGTKIRGELSMQTLFQEQGHANVLLHFAGDSEHP